MSKVPLHQQICELFNKLKALELLLGYNLAVVTCIFMVKTIMFKLDLKKS